MRKSLNEKSSLLFRRFEVKAHSAEFEQTDTVDTQFDRPSSTFYLDSGFENHSRRLSRRSFPLESFQNDLGLKHWIFESAHEEASLKTNS